MAKSYVIRKIAYHYSDEYHYVCGTGGIHSIIKDKAEAEAKLAKLERAAFRECDLGDMEEFSMCSDSCGSSDWKALHAYFLDQFGESLFQGEGDELEMEMDSYLPKKVTAEQVMKIREITGVRFYELGEFDSDEPEFFAIWLNPQNEYLNGSDAPFFFNSQDEALSYAKENLEALFEGLELNGTLEELSEQPAALKAIVDRADDITYDDKGGKLSVDYAEGEEAVSLNALLKEPVFSIKPFSLTDAKKIDHYAYEEM